MAKKKKYQYDMIDGEEIYFSYRKKTPPPSKPFKNKKNKPKRGKSRYDEEY